MSQIYYVVSTVRSIHTRLARFQSPTRNRFKQYILGGSVRLIRSRPVPISDKQLMSFEDELRGLADQGKIQVRRDSPEGPIYVFGEKVEATKPEPKPEPRPEPKEEKAPEPEVVEVAKIEEEEDDIPPPPPLPTTKKKGSKRSGRKGSKK